MTKNVLIIESSPRKKGNSVILAARAAEALREAGISVESLHLQGMKIAACNHCDGCIRQKQFCIVEDDMQAIYPKLAGADGLILSSPIYWFTYNAQLKLCIDRWYGLWQNRNDFLKGKPVGVILTYGDTDLYTSGAINAIHTFDTTFRFLGARLTGYVYGTTNDVGDAEKNPELMKSAFQMGKKMGASLSG